MNNIINFENTETLKTSKDNNQERILTSLIKTNNNKKNNSTKEYQKNYRENNKNKIQEINKRYYDKNHNHILEMQRKRITCDCGVNISYASLSKHKQSKKHIKYEKLQ